MTLLKTLMGLKRFFPVSRRMTSISAAILGLMLCAGVARVQTGQILPADTPGATGDNAPVAASAAIPITNFSFESGTFVNDGNGTMVLPLGSTVMTGWTVVTDQVAWIISPNPWGLSAQDGNRFLDLTAYPAGAPFGGVSQTLATSIGHTYRVNYYLGTYTSRWGGPPVSILASAGGTSQTCTVSTTSTQSTWTLCSMLFTANSVSTTLSFVGSAGFQYIGLDNVSVEEIGVSGDFDGDGKGDLLLRNKATGQNIGWLMNGLTVSTSALLPTIADTNWEIVGQGQ